MQRVRPQHLGQRRAVGVLQQIQHHHHGVGAKVVKGAERGDGRRRLALHQVLEQADGLAPVGETQHVAHDRAGDEFAMVGLNDGLVEQGLCISHRPLRRPRDQQAEASSSHRTRAPSASANGDEALGHDHLRLDPAQIEALAPRQDGHRHLPDFGGGEDELGVRRRLFQRLQQGVERRRWCSACAPRR